MRKQGITKRFPVFLRLFFAFLKTAGIMLCKGDRKKFPKIKQTFKKIKWKYFVDNKPVEEVADELYEMLGDKELIEGMKV